MQGGIIFAIHLNILSHLLKFKRKQRKKNTQKKKIESGWNFITEINPQNNEKIKLVENVIFPKIESISSKTNENEVLYQPKLNNFVETVAKSVDSKINKLTDLLEIKRITERYKTFHSKLSDFKCRQIIFRSKCDSCSRDMFPQVLLGCNHMTCLNCYSVGKSCISCGCIFNDTEAIIIAQNIPEKMNFDRKLPFVQFDGPNKIIMMFIRHIFSINPSLSTNEYRQIIACIQKMTNTKIILQTNDECPICTESIFPSIVLECKHCICAGCFCEYKKECAICRNKSGSSQMLIVRDQF